MIRLGIIFLVAGASIFVPSYVLMNDDFRYTFCVNYSEGVGTDDFNECNQTVQKDSLRNNAIASIIIIIGGVIMIVSLFPKVQPKIV